MSFKRLNDDITSLRLLAGQLVTIQRVTKCRHFTLC